MKLTKKEKMQLHSDLYDQAVARYLEKTDFDFTEWLSDENVKKYCILASELYGEDCYCGKHEDRI